MITAEKARDLMRSKKTYLNQIEKEISHYAGMGKNFIELDPVKYAWFQNKEYFTSVLEQHGYTIKVENYGFNDFLVISW